MAYELDDKCEVAEDELDGMLLFKLLVKLSKEYVLYFVRLIAGMGSAYTGPLSASTTAATYKRIVDSL